MKRWHQEKRKIRAALRVFTIYMRSLDLGRWAEAQPIGRYRKRHPLGCPMGRRCVTCKPRGRGVRQRLRLRERARESVVESPV